MIIWIICLSCVIFYVVNGDSDDENSNYEMMMIDNSNNGKINKLL